jgi:6-phosphogluconolactonase
MDNRKHNLRSFATREELAEHLAENVGRLLRAAVAERNRAVLVVSGGTTPKPLFIRLAQTNLPWDRVTVTLADERWVDPDDPASNEHLVRTWLLQDKAGSADFVGLKNDFPTAAAGEKKCEERLAELPVPFDVIILGMGNDGHTASLFPGAPQLEKALNPGTRAKCLAVATANAPYGRMTMTLPALLDARRIFLHITGEGKMDVLQQALAGGPAGEMPVRSILLQERTPVQIFWAP